MFKLLEVSTLEIYEDDRIHAPVTLPQEKEFLAVTEWAVEWAPEGFWEWSFRAALK